MCLSEAKGMDIKMTGDTIAAIATALTASGIGIIRISGEEALEIAGKVYRSKNGKNDIRKSESHRIHYGFIYDGEEMIDEVLVMVMKGPRSYTGEDTVEIDCHGGILAMRKVLEAVIHAGARPAEPGEFTKRAFLNGRLDLSQAEAVMDIIQAKNQYALQSSLSQLKGSVLRPIKELREEILYQIAFIESALDDPEHISLEKYPEKLAEKTDKWIEKTESLIASFDNGRIVKEGINTVIVGKPNAGKSSLMNVLVGEDRAIVTDIAGTTRDTLEEQIFFGGISLNVIDTAGIRDTEDIVEKIGVEKAKEKAEKADLMIYVVDSSTDLDENDDEIIEMIKGKKAIVLLNKTDLNAVTTEEQLKGRIDHPIISISAKEKTGIEQLEETLKAMFFHGNLQFNDEVYITNVRQKQALEEAKDSLKQVKNSIDMEMPEDFYSIDLMSAYEALGRITGESVEDDLVNEIFGKFCMGK